MENFKSLLTVFAIIILIGFAVMSSFQRTAPQQSTWHAPKYADTLKNPLKNNAAAAKSGEIVYGKMCAVCHGDKGKGDGIAGANLAKKPADHTSTQVQSLSDGALFWMISNGNAPMPGYSSSLKVNERWQLVNYIRELGKSAKKKTKK
jgi:mono/diheme cytochrome c family protein